MKVTIKERDYDFVPDYPHEWQQSPGGFFKSPVLVGKHKCFVKRFAGKSPRDITGWNLLLRLKYKNENNLPRLYDILTIEENHKEVHYVFYEYIKGVSLDLRLESEILIDLDRLTSDLFSSLKSLNKYEHWIAEFSEKNIFCEDSGRFLLFNLDSAIPATETPESTEDHSIYSELVNRYYREMIDRDIDLSGLQGIALNYLQLIFLVLRIKLFQQEQELEYDSPQLFDHLPAYLDHIDPAFKTLFTRLSVNSEAGAVTFNENEIRDLVFKSIINAPVSLPEPMSVPEIISFKSSTGTVGKGETFTLDWEVKHAGEVELLKNGTPFKKFGPDQSSIAINEFYDGKDREIVYKLVASNDTGMAESLPVSVQIAEAPQPALSPEINDFSSTSLAVMEGEIFTLSWQVAHASYVELFKNARLFQKFGPEVTTLALSESTQGKHKTIEYTLVAGNESNEKKSASLRVRVEHTEKEVKPIGWKPNITILKYLSAVLVAVLVIAFVIFRYFESKPKISYFLPESIAEEHTIIIRGRNFPENANSFQVLFNNVKGNVQYNTDDLIRVGVPYLGGQLNDGNVQVALVIKNDTTYASKRLKVSRLAPAGGFTAEVKGVSTVNDTFQLSDVKPRKKTTPKKTIRVDTTGSKTPEPVIEKEEPKPVIDIMPMVKLVGNDFKKKPLGGIKDLQLTIQNDSPFDLDNVSVEVSYLKKNEKEMKKESVIFSNIRAHTSKTLTMPESNRGTKVSYRIISISSKQLDAENQR